MSLITSISTAVATMLRVKLTKEQIRTYLKEMKGVLKDGYTIEGDSEAGRSCAVFLISGMQMIMEDRKLDGSIGSLLRECADLLVLSYEHLERDKEATPISWDIVRSQMGVIASCVLRSRESDSSSVHAALTALHCLVQYAQRLHDNSLSSIFSHSALPTYGVLLAACLEVYGNEQWMPDIRLSALSIIELLTVGRAANSLASLIPGLLTSLHQQLTTNPTVANVDLLTKSLEIYTSALCTVYTLKGKEDTVDESGTVVSSSSSKKLVVKRDTEWWKTLEERVVQSITHMSASLASHRVSSVRLGVLDTVATVWQLIDTPQSIDITVGEVPLPKLESIVLDLVLVLSEDPDDRVFTLSHSLLSSFPPTSLIDSCHKRLANFSSRLPVAVRMGDASAQLFAEVSSVIRALGSEIAFLAETEDDQLVRFVRSLADCIRVDSKRLSIVNTSESEEEQMEGILKNWLHSLPLQYGVRPEWFDGAACSLASGGPHTLRLLLHLLPPSSSTHDPSLLLLSTLVVLSRPTKNELSIENQSMSIDDELSALIEWSIARLATTQVTTVEREDTVEDALNYGNQSIVSALSLIGLIGASTSAIRAGNLKTRMLVDVLYTLLEWSASPVVSVAECASTAIKEIATSCSLSVSSLLVANGSLIANRVSLAAHRYSLNRQCPLVLSSLLDRLQSSDLSHHLSLIVDDLILALDRYNIDWCVLILRVLYAYTRALNRWYPEMRPLERKNEKRNEQIEEKEEENGGEVEDMDEKGGGMQEVTDDKKPPPPESVAMAEEILKRTKHLLSSLHLPVAILCFSISSECLWHVRAFDDQLLPMVHQNWSALVVRFRDPNYECRLAALKVLVRMSEVCGDFIHRKIRDELWPGLERWLREELKERGSIESSRKQKYLLAVLDSMPRIFVLTRLNETKADELIDICTAFTLHKYQSNTVIQAARRALVTLETKT